MTEEEKKYEKETAILNFQVMTENNQPEVAKQYLENNHWDVDLAARQYFAEQAVAREMHGRIPETFMPIEYSRREASAPIPRLHQGYDQLERSEDTGPGFFARAFGFVSRLFKKSVPRKIAGYEPGGEEFVHLFEEKYSSLAKPLFEKNKLETVIRSATEKKKAMLIVVHDSTAPESISPFLKNTVCNPEIIEYINNMFIPFIIDVGTEEGRKNAEKYIKPTRVPHISVRIPKTNELNTILLCVEEMLPTEEAFYSLLDQAAASFSHYLKEIADAEIRQGTLYRSELVRREEGKDGGHGRSVQDLQAEEDRILKEIQEKEFIDAQRKDAEKKQLEREEEEKKRNLQLVQESIKKEEEIKEQSAKKEKLKKKESIPPEPDKDDPAACEIAFRIPSGNRVTRRFRKDTTIGVLYTFVETLDAEGLAESSFELSQPMPRKVYESMDATLESEGLAPKALIQVGLKD